MCVHVFKNSENLTQVLNVGEAYKHMGRHLVAGKDISPTEVVCLEFTLDVTQSLSQVRLSATPWTAAHQLSLSFTVSRSLLSLMCIEPVMLSNNLIHCSPHLLLPSNLPSIRVFSNESALCITTLTPGLNIGQAYTHMGRHLVAGKVIFQQLSGVRISIWEEIAVVYLRTESPAYQH